MMLLSLFSVSPFTASAFDGCKYLSSVILTCTPESIGENAFADCGLLKEIAIPTNVTKIGKHAFGYRKMDYSLFDNVAIKGVEGSAAYEYAEENGIDFLNLLPEIGCKKCKA